jgi:hypothetical protein
MIRKLAKWLNSCSQTYALEKAAPNHSKYPRHEVNHLRASNGALNRSYKSEMMWVLLDIIIPVSFVLELDYKGMGDVALKDEMVGYG